ncbi:hypothetical protein [Neisseria meningitidis]|uniref:hypothetical protein n=1 Tax=Neisseria meningitidis TaxID=487 RepID=UPI0013DED1B7|nr:hypothetical protein [Neisseria meningitidis]
MLPENPLPVPETANAGILKPVIPDNTVISKPVIPAQAGIQTCPHRNLSDKNSCPNPAFYSGLNSNQYGIASP